MPLTLTILRNFFDGQLGESQADELVTTSSWSFSPAANPVPDAADLGFTLAVRVSFFGAFLVCEQCTAVVVVVRRNRSVFAQVHAILLNGFVSLWPNWSVGGCWALSGSSLLLQVAIYFGHVNYSLYYSWWHYCRLQFGDWGDVNTYEAFNNPTFQVRAIEMPFTIYLLEPVVDVIFVGCTFWMYNDRFDCHTHSKIY